MSESPSNAEYVQLPENARSRALLKAMGYTSDELRRPRIGVANSWGETSPGHVHLRSLGDAVKAGVWQAGGTPFGFNSFGMCPVAPGIHSMRYDTAVRDIVAAEIGAATWLHMFDGLVMISSCDKNVPANLLAACRLLVHNPVRFLPTGLFPIFGGCDAGGFPERPDHVLGGLESALSRDLFDGPFASVRTTGNDSVVMLSGKPV